MKEGITIYGDWDGKVSVDYHAREGESNLIIIDKNGVIRYEASGKIDDENIGIIEKLLSNLAGEKNL